MANDMKERLKNARCWHSGPAFYKLMDEAAARIEELEKALDECKKPRN